MCITHVFNINWLYNMKGTIIQDFMKKVYFLPVFII